MALSPSIQNKPLVLAAAFGLGVLALAAVAIIPLIYGIKKDSEALASIKSEIAALELQQAHIDAFKKNYENYKPNLEKIDGLFTDAKNPVAFIEFLENTAARSGIDAQISLQAQPKKEAGADLAFLVHATDNFTRIREFIERLENGRYLVQIDSVSLNGLVPQEGVAYIPGGVDAVFSIKAFAKP